MPLIIGKRKIVRDGFNGQDWMVQGRVQMGLAITVAVSLLAVLLTFVGPKVTPYNRKQWAFLMTTLIVLWIPMGCYLLFVVVPSQQINNQQAMRAGALNLAVGVPLFIFIARRWILKK